jgi:hypothetical protein
MYYIRGASFWQQNELWRTRAKSQQQQLDITTTVSSVMSSAMTRLSSGLAGIANKQALTRVQAQIKTAINAGLQSGGIQTSPSSSTTQSAPSSSTTGTSVDVTA